MNDEVLNIGTFRELVNVMQPTATKAANGQTIRSYALLKAVYCAVKPVKTDEVPVASRIQYTEIKNFVTHNITELNSKFQLSYKSEVWNIVAIERFNLDKFIQITAVKLEN